MIALLFCILVSTLISLFFKAFQLYGVRNLPAIVVNYFVCVACGIAFQGSFPFSSAIYHADWLPLAGVLGFLFIGGFNLNALCIQRAGIAITSVVQRISLLLSVAFAVLFYKESIGLWQGLGIAIGLVAVVLSVRFQPTATSSRSVWLLPLGVFVVAGAIESLLTVAQRTFSAEADVSFTVTLFLWAGILGLIYALLRPPSDGSPRFTRRDFLGGIALGIPNFFSIHLILLALGDGLKAATVFPILNVATIVLSAVAALVLFKEQLSPKQWTGVGLAVIAIALITGRSS